MFKFRSRLMFVRLIVIPLLVISAWGFLSKDDRGWSLVISTVIPKWVQMEKASKPKAARKAPKGKTPTRDDPR